MQRQASPSVLDSILVEPETAPEPSILDRILDEKPRRPQLLDEVVERTTTKSPPKSKPQKFSSFEEMRKHYYPNDPKPRGYRPRPKEKTLEEWTWQYQREFTPPRMLIPRPTPSDEALLFEDLEILFQTAEGRAPYTNPRGLVVCPICGRTTCSLVRGYNRDKLPTE